MKALKAWEVSECIDKVLRWYSVVTVLQIEGPQAREAGGQVFGQPSALSKVSDLRVHRSQPGL